jgi:hypothetical protein
MPIESNPNNIIFTQKPACETRKYEKKNHATRRQQKGLTVVLPFFDVLKK